MKKLDDVLLNVVAKSHLCPSRLRLVIYRSLGMKIGQADIWPGVGFRGTRCSIGDWSWINHGTDRGKRRRRDRGNVCDQHASDG